MDVIDEGPFVIALKGAQGDFELLGLSGEGIVELLEGGVAVYFGLSLTQEIEIGTVQHRDAALAFVFFAAAHHTLGLREFLG